MIINQLLWSTKVSDGLELIVRWSASDW